MCPFFSCLCRASFLVLALYLLLMSARGSAFRQGGVSARAIAIPAQPSAACCVLELDPLTEAQQRHAINSQLQGEQQELFDHLFNYIRSMEDNDEAYAATCSGKRLETIVIRGGSSASAGAGAPRQRNGTGQPVGSLDELLAVAAAAKAACDRHFDSDSSVSGSSFVAEQCSSKVQWAVDIRSNNLSVR